MSDVQVLLIGGGEHAVVVAEAVRSLGPPFRLVGYVDRNGRTDLGERIGAYLGTDDDLDQHGAARLVLAFGAHRAWAARRQIGDALARRGAAFATIVHRAAYVSPSAILDPGVVVLPGAIIHAGARVGAHGVINSGAVVEHDCRLDPNVHLAPGAVLGGGVLIGADTYVGIRAVVRDHVRIGAGVTIGMGAVVVGPVEDGRLVTGDPAR